MTSALALAVELNDARAMFSIAWPVPASLTIAEIAARWATEEIYLAELSDS